MNKRLRKLLALAVACAFPAAVSAAEITSRRTEAGTAVITLSGEIVSGDAAKFAAQAARYDAAVVVLESEGGKTLEAIEIGETLNRKRFSTLVFNGSRCVSSCGLVWLAGTPRALSRSAQVGFHAAFTNSGGRNLESGVGNAIIGRYFTELDLPLSAVIFATAAPPNEVNWVDRTNAEELGISIDTVDDLDLAPEEPSSGVGDSRAAAIASADFEWEDAPWSVLSNSDRTGCFALLEFSSERGVANLSALEISKERGETTGLLVLRNEKFRSLVDGRDYRIELLFSTGGTDDEGWGKRTFTALEYSSGMRGLYVELDWAALSEDLRREDTVTFKLGDKVIDAFPLAGSAAAMRQLDRCLRTGIQTTVADPFE